MQYLCSQPHLGVSQTPQCVLPNTLLVLRIKKQTNKHKTTPLFLAQTPQMQPNMTSRCRCCCCSAALPMKGVSRFLWYKDICPAATWLRAPLQTSWRDSVRFIYIGLAFRRWTSAKRSSLFSGTSSARFPDRARRCCGRSGRTNPCMKTNCSHGHTWC